MRFFFLARFSNYRFEILNRYLLHSNIWDYLSLHLLLIARVSLKTLAHLSYFRWTYAFCLQVLLLLVVVAYVFFLLSISTLSNGWFHFCSAIGLSVNVSMDWVFLFFYFFFNSLWLFPHFGLQCVFLYTVVNERKRYIHVRIWQNVANIHSIQFSCQMKMFVGKVMNT